MRSGRGEALAVAAAAALAVATALRIVHLAGGWIPPLDDAFIHAAFARNFAENLHWGMHAEASAGESSPGFALLLALGELGPLQLAPQLSLLLGLLAYCALPPLAMRLLPEQFAASRLPLAALTALGGTLLFHAQSGMETLPYLTLGCASLVAFGAGHFRRAALLAAACSWLRLDAWALWLALGLGFYDRARASGSGRRAAGTQLLACYLPGIVVALGAPLWLALASGDFPPATLAGRRWLAGLEPSWGFASLGEGMQTFLQHWAAALSAQYGFGSIGAHFVGEAVWLTALRQLWKICAATLLAFGLWRLLRCARATGLRLFALWTLATFLQYCLLLPARGHAGRYQPQILLGYLLLVALALPPLWRRRWLRPLAGVVLLGVLAASAESLRLSGAASAHLARVHLRAAAEIAESPEQRVAVFDVGAWAYRRHDRWIDISGLGESDFAEWMQRRGLHERLLRQGATHILLPLTENDGPGSLRDRLGLSELDGVELQPLRSWESEDRLWGEAFQLSGNAARRLLLYRLRSQAIDHADQ